MRYNDIVIYVFFFKIFEKTNVFLKKKNYSPYGHHLKSKTTLKDLNYFSSRRFEKLKIYRKRR